MGKGAAKKADAATQQQMDIAQQTFQAGQGLMEAAKPAREAAQGAYLGQVQGGEALTKAVAPQINAANQQFNVARRQMESLPASGMRTKGLSDLTLAQAGSKASIYGGGVQEALARLAAMGWGGTQAGVGAYGQSSGGYGSAATTYSNLSASQAGAWGSLAGGLGSIAGGYLAGR